MKHPDWKKITRMAQVILAILLAMRDGGDFGGPPRQQRREPGPMFGAMDFSIADDGERTGHEQAAQIAVTLLADMAKPVLAPARMLLRHQPNFAGSSLCASLHLVPDLISRSRQKTHRRPPLGSLSLRVGANSPVARLGSSKNFVDALLPLLDQLLGWHYDFFSQEFVRR
jgi:hypothetical protein